MVDEIRTEPVMIVERSKSLAADGILGSATIPKDKVGQITFRTVYTSTPDNEFFICDKSGTVGMIYFPAAGAEVLQGEIKKPIGASIKAGSVRIRTLKAIAAATVACVIRIDTV